jgi:DNA-binding Xre family transcriptional regulator
MSHEGLFELIERKRKDPEFMAEVERGSAVLIAVNALLVELNSLRVQRGWTKAELARAAGMEPSNLRKLLSTGEKHFEIETFVRLVHALGGELKIDLSKANSGLGEPKTQSRQVVPSRKPLEKTLPVSV